MPDVFWIVEKLAEASLLASREPAVVSPRESLQVGCSSTCATLPLLLPAKLFRAFHAFMLTLTGGTTPGTISTAIAAARASQKPSLTLMAKEAALKARPEQTAALAASPPAAPTASTPSTATAAPSAASTSFGA